MIQAKAWENKAAAIPARMPPAPYKNNAGKMTAFREKRSER
ncbi:hypothetical protein BCO26_2314 [Heyndrickxia coagulans 2-6]|nr:hypothetical protein BCO26_2314 [Heyndrickxia coagulans 2-6]